MRGGMARARAPCDRVPVTALLAAASARLVTSPAGRSVMFDRKAQQPASEPPV